MSHFGPEYETLEQCYPTLVSCLQQAPSDIVVQLRPFGILAPGDITFLRNVYIDDSTKAERIVDAVMNQVQGDPGVYHKFVAALKAAGKWTQTATKKLEHELASLSHNKTDHEKSIRAALSDEPTLKELCALPVEKVWYQLGLWLGVDEWDLQWIKKREYEELHQFIKADSLLPGFDKEVSISYLKKANMFKCFCSLDNDYDTFIQKLPTESRETLVKFFVAKDNRFAQECERVIEKIRDPKVKAEGEQLFDSKCKRFVLVKALVKVGLKQEAEEICKSRGRCQNTFNHSLCISLLLLL